MAFQPIVSFDEIIHQRLPTARLGCLLCSVNVQPSGPGLLNFISEQLQAVEKALSLENIHDIPPLHATREAYKILGKDPSRYRPSAEALLRRVVQGKGFYEVNNVVDALNLVSVKTGFSIGGYDAAKISGNIRFGRGEEGEPYEAIGRGVLNIHNLPVLRDNLGAFGSPTSDSVRTMVTEETTQFLAVFFDFWKSDKLEKSVKEIAEMLGEFANGSLPEINII